MTHESIETVVQAKEYDQSAKEKLLEADLSLFGINSSDPSIDLHTLTVRRSLCMLKLKIDYLRGGSNQSTCDEKGLTKCTDFRKTPQPETTPGDHRLREGQEEGVGGQVGGDELLDEPEDSQLRRHQQPGDRGC